MTEECAVSGEKMNDTIKIRSKLSKTEGMVQWWCGSGIFGNCKTPFVRVDGKLCAQNYIDQIVTNSLVPFDNRQIDYSIHDNAPPHRTLITRSFLAENNIPTLDWPSVSPDLNSIENL